MRRMTFSWFQPKGEPTREARVSQLAGEFKPPSPTVDERTALAANELLENQAFERAFKRIEAEAHRQFTASTPGVNGVQEREIAYTKVRALAEIRSSLEAMRDELKLHKARDIE